MKTLLLLSYIATLVLCAQGGARQPIIRAPERAATTGSYIVVLKENLSKEELLDVVARATELAQDVEVYHYTERIAKTFTAKLSSDTLEKVRRFPEVLYIEEEDMAYGSATPPTSIVGRSPYYLWYLDRLNQPLDSYLHKFKPGDGKGVDIYILDSGISYQHVEFENRAKYAGYDPIDQSSHSIEGYKPMRGQDCNGHGTLVASLAGGKTYGIAKEAMLYSVRVLNCNQAGRWGVVLDGLEFVSSVISERKRPAVVCMALSGSVHSSVNTAIQTLSNQGVLVVASAGNSNRDACTTSPASSPLALTVGAAAYNETIYDMSNYGRCVDIFAPGEMIQGADRSCQTCETDFRDGTSLATPLVTGIAAAHLSKKPLLKADELKQKIIDTSLKNVLDLDIQGVIPREFRANTPNRLASFRYGGSLIATEVDAQLQSPCYPANYPNNLEYTWTIVAEELTEDQSLQIEFSYLKLETSYDTLSVCQGTSCDPQNTIAILTGDYGETNCSYSTKGSVLTLLFKTDGTFSAPGFQLTYRISTSDDRECVVPVTKTSIQLSVLSAGLNFGNYFSLSRDWEEIFSGRRQGINLAILDEVTGEILHTENSNAYSSAAASDFASRIENTHPGQLVLLGVSGRCINLNDRSRRAIKTLGSERIHQLGTYGSWALIGVKGARPGTAVEAVDNSASVRVSREVQLQSERQFGLAIEVISAGTGFYVGNYAEISIGGQVISITNSTGDNYDRGLNVAVFNESTRELIQTAVFDTHSFVTADIKSPADEFADFINSLPDGRVVAIAVKGDGFRQLSERAKVACESIGSRLVHRLQQGSSWSIVGRKGAGIGTVPEAASDRDVARVVKYLPYPIQPSCTVSLTSSGFQNSFKHRYAASLAVGNNVLVLYDYVPDDTWLRGITVAIVDQTRCAMESWRSFDTHFITSASKHLANYIDNVPSGKIVVAAIWDEGIYALKEAGYRALESIGSGLIRNVGYRNPWAIIGRKSAPPGSVPEVIATHTVSVGAKFAVEETDIEVVG